MITILQEILLRYYTQTNQGPPLEERESGDIRSTFSTELISLPAKLYSRAETESKIKEPLREYNHLLVWREEILKVKYSPLGGLWTRDNVSSIQSSLSINVHKCLIYR